MAHLAAFTCLMFVPLYCSFPSLVIASSISLYRYPRNAKKLTDAEHRFCVRQYKNMINLSQATVHYSDLSGPDPASVRPPWLIASLPPNRRCGKVASPIEVRQVVKYARQTVAVLCLFAPFIPPSFVRPYLRLCRFPASAFSRAPRVISSLHLGNVLQGHQIGITAAIVLISHNYIKLKLV